MKKDSRKCNVYCAMFYLSTYLHCLPFALGLLSYILAKLVAAEIVAQQGFEPSQRVLSTEEERNLSISALI